MPFPLPTLHHFDMWFKTSVGRCSSFKLQAFKTPKPSSPQKNLKTRRKTQDAPQAQAVLQASSRSLKLQPFKLERRPKPSRRASTSRLQEDLKNSSRASSPQVASRPRVQVLKPRDASQERWSVRRVTLFITPDADIHQLYYMFPAGPQCRHIKTSVG